MGGKGWVSPLREPDNLWEGTSIDQRPRGNQWIPDKLPEDPESERSLLSTCCAPGAERKSLEVSAILHEKDFVVPSHRIVFSAMSKLAANDEEINSLSLKAEIEKAGKLNLVGGYPGLVELLMAEEVGNPAVLAEYIKEKSRLRQLIHSASELIRSAAEGVSPSSDLVTEHITKLADIASSNTRKESIPLSDIVVDAKHGRPFSPHGCSSKVGCFGIEDLDHKCYIPIGEPTLIAARPGVGKTALAVQSAFKSAERGAKVLFVSMELTEEKLKARFAAYLTGVGAEVWLAGEYSPFHADLLDKHRETLDSIRVISPDQGIPWSQLEADIRLNINKYGTNLVYIDYFGFIGLPKRDRGENKAYLYADIMTGITALCKNAQIGVVVLCQLTKDATARGSKKPTLTELADTDRPARDAALTLMLYQLQDGRQTWASIAKNRNGSADYDKMVEFDGATNRFNAIIHYTEER